ncbi:hypothetical protein HK100_011075 [Physocladia obscura]|uniref:J domain-containing protein n=1 Tax=Physocladia obscura TaxID=109957 RepID=A0AAD5XEE4_9FUNG|nr:hypothetical protein HK100_011075 [Physocladia obscura]
MFSRQPIQTVPSYLSLLIRAQRYRNPIRTNTNVYARLVSSTPVAHKRDFNPYKTLGVTTTADERAIKKAYYAKVFELHPDRLTAKHKHLKPGSVELKRKQAEFLASVKAFEILSNPIRRKAFDMDHARGDTRRYANEAEGKSHDADDTTARARKYEWEWDPRQEYGRAGYSSKNSGYNYNKYAGYGGGYSEARHGPMNTAPLYMANWKFGLLVFGFACVGSTTMFYLGLRRMKAHEEALDLQDRKLVDYYERKRREAITLEDAIANMRNEDKDSTRH